MWPASIAAVAGALAGPVLARALFARVQDAGVVPEVLALRQGVLPLVVGAVAALLAVRVSAAFAARRAARARLHEALGEVEEARVSSARSGSRWPRWPPRARSPAAYHTVHAAGQRGRDGRDRARRRDRLRARRSMADRAPHRRLSGRRSGWPACPESWPR